MRGLKALILGYGNAGKRHGELLDKLGILWDAYDPFMTNGQANWQADVLDPTQTICDISRFNDERGDFDFIVVASPPATHLSYIEQALAMDMPVLCEKPLCDWEQLNKARRLPGDAPIMMAFNYRFHPTWVAVKSALQEHSSKDINWWLCLSQERNIKIPNWGLFLDRAAHTLDQLHWLSGWDSLISDARISEDCYRIEGRLGIDHFMIWKAVGDVVPVRGIMTPDRFVAPDEDANEEMYLSMYQCFLDRIFDGTPFVPGIKEGLAVQESLESARRKNVMRRLSQ